MDKNLDEYITTILKDYEEDKNSGHFPYTEEEKELRKEYYDCQHKLIEMLDGKQKEIFNDFYICIKQKETAIKSEYFTLGFFHGFMGEKEFGKIFD